MFAANSRSILRIMCGDQPFSARCLLSIHQRPDWPTFTWDAELLAPQLIHVRYLQGRLLGHMASIGIDLRNEADLSTMTLDVLRTSEIEGEVLDPEQVRSSLSRRLGLDIAGARWKTPNTRLLPYWRSIASGTRMLERCWIRAK